MTNAKKLAFAAVAVCVAVLAACSDRRPDSGVPTAPKLVRDAMGNVVMGTCTTYGDLNSLAAQIFGGSSDYFKQTHDDLKDLKEEVAQNHVTEAQKSARKIVAFVQNAAAHGGLRGTQAQVNALIAGVLCYAGLAPDTFLVQPSDTAQFLKTNDGTSGVSLPPNPVGTPTLLTISTIPPTGPSPLLTKLDQYPSYVLITVSSPLTAPADVRVCPAGVPNDSVRHRLRLGHQVAPDSAHFEITAPPQRPSSLDCGALVGAAPSRVPGWLRNVASLILPKALYARQFEADRGGVGGSVIDFSPFGAVDPEVEMERGGGVGGSVIDFKKSGPKGSLDSTTSPPAKSGSAATIPPSGAAAMPSPTGPAFSVDASGNCTQVSVTVGQPLEPGCRPVIIIRTRNGTRLLNVPVTWAVESGGGVIAPETVSSQACGPTFGSGAQTLSDGLGKAGVCWTLGPNGGTNTVTAIPSPGGDAPGNVYFGPLSTPGPHGLRFTATGIKITPTAGATGGSFTFDNIAHPGTFSCSNALTAVVKYSVTGGADLPGAPVAVGSYTLTVTCGDGDLAYNTVTATAAITISVMTPSVSVSCPVSATYTGAALTPCGATVTGPGLSATPTPVYANNTNVGTATATVEVPASGNYGAASGSGSFAITPAATTTTVSCTGGPYTFSGAAITPCTAATTGPGGLAATTPVSYSDNVNVGTATATATYAAAGNYLGSADSKTFSIGAAATNTVVSCPAGTSDYTGAPLTPCSATTTGPGLNAATAVSYGNNTNVGTASAIATYAATGNYLASTGTGSFAIGAAATTTTVMCPASVPYTGSGQTPCSATTTGTNGFSTATPVAYANNVNAGTASATAAFAAAGNYAASSGSATFTISAITPTVSVSCPASGVTYTGSAQTPCTATVTAAGGLSLTPTPAYSSNTDAGTATAAVSFAATGNYGAAADTKTFVIGKAASATLVSCPASATYTGSALTPCTAATTGAGGLGVSDAITYSSNTNVGMATASASFAGDANHDASSDSRTFAITPASSLTTVSCPVSAVFSNAPIAGCTASATGAGGLNVALTPTYSGNTNVGTATATATFAGDANHAGSGGSATFAITAAQATVSLSCPASVPYGGTTLNPCAASVTAPGLGQAVTVGYSPSPVKAAVSYTATAAFAGGGNYLGQSKAATFSVTKIAATATAGSGTMLFGATVPTLPCSVTGLASGDAGAVTCTTSIPAVTGIGTYVTTPVANPANPANYTINAVTGTLTVTGFAQQGCFASPISATMPPTSTYQKKGNSITVKCRLVDGTGRPIVTAKGNLLVQDKGTNGLGAGTTVYSGTNVFTVSDDHDFSADDGFYTYKLSTSPSGFVVNHYYLVKATWSDGTTTTGWFYLKSGS